MLVGFSKDMGPLTWINVTNWKKDIPLKMRLIAGYINIPKFNLASGKYMSDEPNFNLVTLI